MNFQFLTPNGDNFRIPLLEPHKLWDNPKFNRNFNTTLLVTGWNTNVNSTNEAVDTLFRAYKHRKINFVVGIFFYLLKPKSLSLFKTKYNTLQFRIL